MFLGYRMFNIAIIRNQRRINVVSCFGSKHDFPGVFSGVGTKSQSPLKFPVF